MSENTPLKITPKAQVTALFPNAEAIKRPDGSWVVETGNQPDGSETRVLGENGSATGAWANAAKNLDTALESAATLKTKPEFLEPSDKLESVFDVEAENEAYENARRTIEVPDTENAPMPGIDMGRPKGISKRKWRLAQKLYEGTHTPKTPFNSDNVGERRGMVNRGRPGAPKPVPFGMMKGFGAFMKPRSPWANKMLQQMGKKRA